MDKKKFSQRVFLNTFFAVIFIIILISNYFSYQQIDKISTSNQWVKHTHQVMEVINNILLGTMQVESSVRGYSITGDISFIKNLEGKITTIFDNFEQAKKLTKDNLQQQTLLEKLGALLNERINNLKEAISLKQANKFQSGTALLIVHQGQNLTARIQETIKEIYGNELELLQKREEVFLQDFNSTNIIFNTADLVSTLLLLLTMLFLNKMLSQLVISKNQAKQSESLIKGIIGGSKEYIAALDLNYNFIALNESFKNVFHDLFRKKIEVGKNIKDALAHLPAEQKKVLALWERALKGEEFTVIEKFGSDVQSQKQYEVTYSSIYNEQNQLIGASVIARDIGKRVEQEKNLKDSHERLEISLRKVEAQAKEMTIINDMNNKLGSSASLEETLSMTTLFLKKILPFCSGAIYLMNHSRNYLEALAEWNEPNLTEKIFSPDQCWGLRLGKIYFYLNRNENIPCKHCEGQNPSLSYFCVPLLALNDIVGILYLQITSSLDMQENEIVKLYEQNSSMIEGVAGQISLAISSIKSHEQLKSRSTRDLLTGLYNRSYLNDTFERDIQRAKRSNSPMAIVMMDFDFFKNINDTYGHEAGDIVLREASKLLTAQLRKSDIACRYGGEEIIIILYDTILEDAIDRLEQIRKKIANMEFRFVNLLTVTASFGVAMFPENGEDPEQLIKAADEALYQSKKTGRNRVTVYKKT